MPELPDVTLYVEALQARLLGQPLERVRLVSPFLLRTADPPLSAVEGKRALNVSRSGKRIVLALEEDLFLVLHLMIAGRFHWREAGSRIPGKVGLAAFDFPAGTLLLTEASSRKRASLHLVLGASGLATFQRSGVEVLDVPLEGFREALWRESHTLKRALTDPDLFSGIGNAYSDEILHRARLSPLKLTRQLNEPQVERLYRAAQGTLREWIERLRAELAGAFPEKVTAFRPGMAVHGRFGQPCPVCGSPVQRIVYAENECTYCPRCQTEGRLLADRALSLLLKKDWPRTLEELDQRRQVTARGARAGPAPVG